MINLSSQIIQPSGDINYLIIEYLKSIPFSDNDQKDQLINKVSYIFLIFLKLFLVWFCYDLI